MTTYPLGGVIVDPGGYTSVVVNFTSHAAGTQAVAFSDPFGLNTVTLPATIAARTKFYMDGGGGWLVSAKVGGTEMSGLVAEVGGGKVSTVSLAPLSPPELGTALGTLAAGNDSRITGAAPLASPALTGTPTAPTAAVSTATTQIATTQFVSTDPRNYLAPLASGDTTGATDTAALAAIAAQASATNPIRLWLIPTGDAATFASYTPYYVTSLPQNTPYFKIMGVGQTVVAMVGNGSCLVIRNSSPPAAGGLSYTSLTGTTGTNLNVADTAQIAVNQVVGGQGLPSTNSAVSYPAYVSAYSPSTGAVTVAGGTNTYTATTGTTAGANGTIVVADGSSVGVGQLVTGSDLTGTVTVTAYTPSTGTAVITGNTGAGPSSGTAYTFGINLAVGQSYQFSPTMMWIGNSIGEVGGFTIDGLLARTATGHTTGAACGVECGDIYDAVLSDIKVRNFTGTSSYLGGNNPWSGTLSASAQNTFPASSISHIQCSASISGAPSTAVVRFTTTSGIQHFSYTGISGSQFTGVTCLTNVNSTQSCTLNSTTTVTYTGTVGTLLVGYAVSGTDIPNNTWITAISYNPLTNVTTLTLNNAASGSTTTTLTFGTAGNIIGSNPVAVNIVPGDAGFWFNNNVRWTERLVAIKLRADNCTNCFVFDVNGTGTNSHEFSQLDMDCHAYPNQNGIVVQNGAVVNTRVRAVGLMYGGGQGAANNGYCLMVGADGSSAAMGANASPTAADSFEMKWEGGGGAGGPIHFDMAIGPNAWVMGDGPTWWAASQFQQGYQAGTWATGGHHNSLAIAKYGNSFAAIGAPIALPAGTDTSGVASGSSVTLGSAAQVSTTQDMDIYIQVTTTGQLTIANGSSSSVTNTLLNATSAPAGSGFYVHMPKGWYIAVTTSGSAVWSARSQKR